MHTNVENMTPAEARDWMDTRSVDDYQLVDVREDWEYEEFHIPGAHWVPLAELSERMAELDPAKPTVVYCAAGGRSMAAANMLAGRDFSQVFNLKGGIMAWGSTWPALHVEGGPDLGLQLLTGNETPLELTALAYCLEENLADFYRDMAGSAPAELAGTFATLARFEDAHKDKVLNLVGENEAAACTATSEGEGGVDLVSFVAERKDILTDAQRVLDMALMLEATAMDMYMRFADAAEKPETADAAHKLADEEKRHMLQLTRMKKALA